MTNFIREPCMDCIRKDKTIEDLQDELQLAQCIGRQLRAEVERLTQQNADLRRWRALERPLVAALAIVSNDMQELHVENELLRSQLNKYREPKP